MSPKLQNHGVGSKRRAAGDAAWLRHRAEARVRNGTTDKSLPDADAKRLLHELQVHQVELEMQNAELTRARAEAEASAKKFSDLYDFAPVGYITLNERGVIRELNLTAARLLGRDRIELAGRPFANWVAPGDRASLQDHLRTARATKAKLEGEVEILVTKRPPTFVQVGTIFRDETSDLGAHFGMVLTDVTALKQAEARVRQLNVELEARVAARTAEIEALLERSRDMQAQLRGLSHRVLEAQEEERKRISRELHDQIAQVLISINFDLMALSRATLGQPEALRKRIERTHALVESSVNALHRFTRELRPSMLDDLGLIPALGACLEEFKNRTGIRVRFTAYPGVEQLNGVSRMTIFRVAQSALSNIEQHAKASRVTVRIHQRPKAACMEIVDDGIGFKPSGGSLTRKGRRLGLLGMRERMEMVGGTLTIQSAPGHGTTLRAEFPAPSGRRLRRPTKRARIRRRRQ